MPTILFTAPYMIPFLERFRPTFERYNLELVTVPVTERLDKDQILKYAGTFDGTICGDDSYTAEVLQACVPRLKVISKWGTGIDSIDAKAAEELGVLVKRTPNAFTMPVADTVLGYILAFTRRQPWMDKDMKAGRWEKLPGRAMNECTIGVIGVGNIGKAVLERAHSFGMKLIGNDIVQIDQEFIEKFEIDMTSLKDLLSQADFVSLNCDLNPTSFQLINSNTLAMMKTNAVLINTARGQVVEEQALISALQCGLIAGAALDVFENEPLPVSSALRTMDNVMLAPHNSNSSRSAWEAVHWNSIRNLLDGLNIPFDNDDLG